MHYPVPSGMRTFVCLHSPEMSELRVELAEKEAQLSTQSIEYETLLR